MRAGARQGWRSYLQLLPELGLVVLVTTLVFTQSRYPLMFLVPPALILLAINRGLAGATAGVVVVALMSTGFTLADTGPIMLIHGPDGAHGDARTQVPVLLAFVAVNTLMAISVGAATV